MYRGCWIQLEQASRQRRNAPRDHAPRPRIETRAPTVAPHAPGSPYEGSKVQPSIPFLLDSESEPGWQ